MGTRVTQDYYFLQVNLNNSTNRNSQNHQIEDPEKTNQFEAERMAQKDHLDIPIKSEKIPYCIKEP